MKVLGLLLMSTLWSCASYTPGQFAQIVKSNSNETIAISGNIDDNMSVNNFTTLNLYFYNPSEKDWRRIKNIDVVEVENHPDIRVIIGKDLYYWAKSMEYKRAIDNHNREMFLGSIALAGAGLTAVGAGSNSNATMAAGLAVTIGSIAVSEVNNLMDKVSNLERASLVPETHLYSPFSIPPELVTNKWIVFQKMTKTPFCALKLKVTFLDSTEATYSIQTNELGCAQ